MRASRIGAGRRSSWGPPRSTPSRFFGTTTSVSFDDTTARMEWAECWLEPTPVPPELARDVRRMTGGVVPAWATHLARVPWVVRATGRFAEKRIAYMPLELWDLIAFVVSQDNSCRFCYGATRAMLSVRGYRDDQIDRLERDVHLADLTRAERAALDFARKVSHANPRPAAADRMALAVAGLSAPAVAEIAYATAATGFPNRISTFFALRPEAIERWVRNPLFRLVRPIAARMMRGKHKRPRPAPSAGPCGDVVAALGDAPAATTLRTTIDEALASPVLPRRTKLLMLGVIGRALGCDRSEIEAREALADEGLGRADVDTILTNLGSPMLDRRDALLVPFARETVRYQNGIIQRRVRELASTLSLDEVVEAAGVAALANVVARLSVLLETC